MKTHTNGLTARASVTAARGALVAMALVACAGSAVAQDAADLTNPTSTIEVGPGSVGDGSYKAGEYNGLQTKGAFGVGNIDLRGGGAFDSDSALRWRVKGVDLGLETRSLSAEIGRQGKFRLGVGYDALLRNRSDSYQTPLIGAESNILTLPGAWLVPTVAGSTTANSAVNVISARGFDKKKGDAGYIDTNTSSATMGALLAANAAQKALVDAAADADLPLFKNVNLFTKRTRFDANVSYSFSPKWGFDASYRPEHKEGMKPMGTVSRNTGGDISTVIPDRIDTDHNQVSASLSYKGARSFLQAGYYGSVFNNNVPFMSWQNWATGPTGTAAGTVNTMSSTPDNRFGQFNASGGLSMSHSTKLVVNGSYARATQNDAFLVDVNTPVVPVSSLNALVVNTLFNARLSTRPTKKLNLTGAYKFDDRDNRTPVNIYQFADAGEPLTVNANFPAGAGNPYGALVANNANANRPYARRMNQATVDADYAVAKREWVRAGYEFEKLHRACNGSWISCSDAETTNENTLRGEWRLAASERLNARLDYAYSARRTPNYNENAFLAIVPYANVSPATATGGASALSFMKDNGWTGYGPAAGFATTTGNMNVFFPSNNALANALYANANRISELPGMRRYYVADRNRHKVRAMLNWQATERFSIQGGGDYNKDAYPDSTYGVQDVKGWVADLDGTYALGDETSIDVTYTYENSRSMTAGNSYTANSNTAVLTNGQPGSVGLSGNSCDGYTTLQQRNNNNKIDPCLNWSSNMLDTANTVGLGLRKKAGAFDLTGNLIYSRAEWDNTVTGGNWANNILNGPGGAPTTVAALFIQTTPWPTVTTETAELRLNARYTVRRQSVHVGYSYMHMTSADPAYDAMQPGTLSGVLPSFEQSFKYGVNVFGVSYILAF